MIITLRVLDFATHKLNEAAGTPLTRYNDTGGANVGHFYLAGMQTHRGDRNYLLLQCVEVGNNLSTRRVSDEEYLPPKVVHSIICALIKGIEIGKALQVK